MSDRLTRIGEMAHGTVRHDDVCWLIGEIERLRKLEVTLSVRRLDELDEISRPDLKLLLMELGNSLVIDHGWDPPCAASFLSVSPLARQNNSTELVAALTEQINAKPAMQESLTALGVEWPMPVGEVI
jgi:hypothetical protein